MHFKSRIQPAFAFMFLLVAGPLQGLAQDRNAFSFSGGYSLPLGKFASENLNDPEAGLAGSGVFGQLSYERKLAPWWGLRLTGSLNINKTDPQPLIDRYSKILTKPESYTWEEKTSRWRLGAMLLGPSGFFSLGSAELEGHVQGGFVFAESPGVTLGGTSSAGSPSIEGNIAQASTSAFGFGAGASLRFRLTRQLRFQLTADAIAANAQLKNVKTSVKVNNVPLPESTSSPKRFVTVLNAGAGLVVVF